MYQIFFEGVRCFHDFHSCPIKPITLLVGENSSGKTTFLALTRIAWDIIKGGLNEDLFNEEPFLLGSYDQVASFKGGRAGRVKSFRIGLRLKIKPHPIQRSKEQNSSSIKITTSFVLVGSELRLDELNIEYSEFNLIAKRSIDKPSSESSYDIILKTSKESKTPSYLEWLNTPLTSYNPFGMLMEFIRLENQKAFLKGEIFFNEDYIYLENALDQIRQSLRWRPYAFAPIRTRPQRTYDPLKVVYDPEGSHVPMLLNRILTDESEEGERLRKALNFFGKTSGLFKKIEAKRKGNKDSDPFQIGVKTTGPSFNLIDVGYGVSQALPLIVDIVLNPSGSTFLLQQPEVHLHPQAQAGLGSFLAYTAKEQNKTFVIETHSDYLIDRIRMDVRDKKYITPDDVAILYFEKEQGNVKIHELKLDEYGNIIDAPPSYRQFFLEEERRMLGI